MGHINFAVIGAGSGGKAAAAHLSLLGYNVNLYNRSEQRIEAIRKMGGVEVEGVITGFGKLNKITADAKEAIEDADVLMVFVPANAHKDLANICASHLHDGQIILLNPGRTWGAIEFTNTLRMCESKANVAVAETQTILYTCRTTANNAGCNIIAFKKRVPLAAFPACRTSEIISVLNEAFPQFVAADDVFETGLNNVGSILHPAPTLLNIGWIETLRTEFKYYYEGITPTVACVLEQLDKERLLVAEAMEVKAISLKDWLYVAYGAKGETLYESLQNNESYKTIYAPSTIRHRYLWEDVPTGLVPIASLAEALEILLPVTNQIIDLACLVCGVDFRKEGRTLESIGLNKFSLTELRGIVKYGA